MNNDDKYEELVGLALDCGIGVLKNSATADDKQVAIAAAVIRTIGPEPLGLPDIAEAQAAGTTKALKAAAQPPQHTGRSMPPGKG